MSKGKGSGFEREFCRQLSLWWTDGDNDSVFWRTSNSGGRATVRGRQDKETYGQYGDICATHPCGQVLTEVLTVELKRGYNKFTMNDLLDKSTGAAQQKWEEFYQQIDSSATLAKSYSWILVSRRDQRVATITMPWMLIERLKGIGCFVPTPIPFFSYTLRVRIKRSEGGDREMLVKLGSMLLNDWFARVSPEDIKELWRLI